MLGTSPPDNAPRMHYCISVAEGIRLLHMAQDASPIISGFIMGSGHARFSTFYGAVAPFRPFLAYIDVPSLIRLQRAIGPTAATAPQAEHEQRLASPPPEPESEKR